MIAIFVHDDKVVDYIPAEDTPAGSVIVQGELIGITKLDIRSGQLGALHLTGVYDVSKTPDVFSVGDSVYWDATAKKAAGTAEGNTLLGVAVAVAASSDATVRVRIG
jgi:predicted RecA/RadA family phage recombinase